MAGGGGRGDPGGGSGDTWVALQLGPGPKVPGGGSDQWTGSTSHEAVGIVVVGEVQAQVERQQFVVVIIQHRGSQSHRGEQLYSNQSLLAASIYIGYIDKDTTD